MRPSPGAYVRESFLHRSRSAERYANDWCRIEISGIPSRALAISVQGEPSAAKMIPPALLKGGTGWTFRVQVSNIKAPVGPLRYCSQNINHYQAQYAYLLNDAKTDFFLQAGESLSYPSGYAFVTHYSAAPLEEILISFDKLPSGRDPVSLCYVDRVFLHDTLRYPVSAAAVRRESRLQLNPASEQ